MSESVKQIYPQEAWKLLEANPQALLVDVRTVEEWKEVGIPNLSDLGQQVVLLSWVDKFRTPNETFFEDLSKRVSKDQPVLFMCRSGGRSGIAAQEAIEQGINAYNVVRGYEGTAEHKGNLETAGWKLAGLPYEKYESQ